MRNLRDRLRRLRETDRNVPPSERPPVPLSGAAASGEDAASAEAAALDKAAEGVPRGLEREWCSCGFRTVRRKVTLDLRRVLPLEFPNQLAILVPDLFRAGIPLPEELLFFDLETSGLSGGAGTVAFLAAFGRFVPPSRLEVRQYLLLDYPGEADFIEIVVKEFTRAPRAIVVSYNGKAFDSQILKTRCLMNGIMAPVYFHADLLHPSRRIWKRLLPDCSQSTIEENILGLDRTDDVPGALAPEIWFSFLRSGETRELLSICDHNIRDIQGLARIFLALGEIAAEPFESRAALRFDTGALALSWNEALKKRPAFFAESERAAGELLLETAAKNGHPRAAFALAQGFFKKGRGEEARNVLLKVAEADSGEVNFPGLKAAAYKSLAVDAEWRMGDSALALKFTNAALAVREITPGFKNDLDKRRARLERKSGKVG